MSDPFDDSEILDDEPCGKCGYNLHGLRIGGRCPECGTVIPPSFPPEVDQDPLAPFVPVAQELNVPVDAVVLVADAMAFTGNRARYAGRRKPRFSAEEFGWGLRDYAVEKFGDSVAARAALESLGLRRSEDVGAIVFALVRAKLIEAEPGDRVEDFDDLFAVATLFLG